MSFDASGTFSPQSGERSASPVTEQAEHKKSVSSCMIALIKRNSPSNFTLVVKSRGKEKLRETKWEPSQEGWPVHIVQIQGSLKTEHLYIELRKDRMGGYQSTIAAGELSMAEVEAAIHNSHNQFEISLSTDSQNLLSMNKKLILIVEISTPSLLPVWITSITLSEPPNNLTEKTLESLVLIFKSDQGETLRESLWNASHELWDVGLPQLRGSTTECLSIELLRTRRVGISRESLATVVLNLKELEQARKDSKKEIMKTLPLSHANKLNIDKLVLTVHIGALNMPLTDTRHFALPPFVGQTLENISIVTGVVDKLSEIHPAAKLAWLVASVPLLLLQKKQKLDDKLEDLIYRMSQVYNCATVKDDPLHNYENFQQLFDNMIQESIKCFLFILNYISDGHFKHMVNASKKVTEFTQTFRRLKDQFSEAKQHVAATAALAARDIVSNVDLEARLERRLGNNINFELPSGQPRCLSDTRKHTLSKIFSWASTGKESLLWLSGIAGSGKSTIMATLHDCLAQTGHPPHSSHLAAYLRFHRVSCSSPSSFVKALAYRLANFDKCLGIEIAKVLDDQPVVLQQPLDVQLESLIIQPLNNYQAGKEIEGQIVVMIDGLDECMEEAGGSDTFHELLTLLSHLASPSTFRLLPFLRFIVASRPEAPIHAAFMQPSTANNDPDDQPSILHFRLDTSSPETTADILKYLTIKFGELFRRNSKFKELCEEEDAVSRLARSSYGLFIWANVVVRFLQLAQNRERLQAALDISIPKDASARVVLNELYSTVLDSVAAEHSDKDVKSQICTILGTVIAVGRVKARGARPPGLTETILRGLLVHLDDKVDDILSLLPRLGAIIEGVHSADAELFLLHKSLDDYLTDADRAGNAWHIDVKSYWIPQVAEWCIRMVHSNVFNDTSTTSDVLSFAHCYWTLAFLSQLDSKCPFPTESMLSRMLLEILQQGFLRWVYCVHNHQQAGFGRRIFLATVFGLTETMDTGNQTPEVVREVVRILFGWHPSGKQSLCSDLQYIFLCFCLNPDETLTLRQYSLPQFSNIASGSRDFFTILHAIETVTQDSDVLLDLLTPMDAFRHDPESDDNPMVLNISGVLNSGDLERMLQEIFDTDRLDLSRYKLLSSAYTDEEEADDIWFLSDEE